MPLLRVDLFSCTVSLGLYSLLIDAECVCISGRRRGNPIRSPPAIAVTMGGAIESELKLLRGPENCLW